MIKQIKGTKVNDDEDFSIGFEHPPSFSLYPDRQDLQVWLESSQDSQWRTAQLEVELVSR